MRNSRMARQLVTAITIGMIAIFAITACGGDPGINAQVNRTIEGVRIANDNDYQWGDITFKLNGKYKKSWRAIDPTTSVLVGWGVFVDDDGFPFDPQLQVAREFHIRIREPGVKSMTFTWN